MPLTPSFKSEITSTFKSFIRYKICLTFLFTMVKEKCYGLLQTFLTTIKICTKYILRIMYNLCIKICILKLYTSLHRKIFHYHYIYKMPFKLFITLRKSSNRKLYWIYIMCNLLFFIYIPLQDLMSFWCFHN